jgi:hypothetical protein
MLTKPLKSHWKDVQNKADQLIKNRSIEQQPSGRTTEPWDHANTRSRMTIERTMFFKYMSWDLPIGKLLIQTTEDYRDLRRRNLNARNDRARTKNWTLKVIFQAPSWISSTILQLSYTCRSQSGLTNWNRNLSYGLQNYNPDPLLHRLIQKSDLSGLQQLFLDGRARPNDYLPFGWPLLHVCAKSLFSLFIFVCLEFILVVPT